MSNLELKHVTRNCIIATALAVTLFSCENSAGSKDKADTNSSDSDTDKIKSTEKTVEATNPADSTGVMATIGLGFARLKPTSALGLQESAVLDLGNGLELSDARLSIGSIKIKANKETDKSEDDLKQALEGEKKSRESAMESDKKNLELEKEAIEAKYEPKFEGAEDSEKDVLKAEMKAEIALVEEKIAALEFKKEEELASIEEQKDGNFKWRGPFVYSLIDNSVTPAIPEAQLVDGSYKRIEFKIKPNRTLGGTDPMLNNAIYLAGKAMVNGAPTPFTASFRIDEEFKLMGAGALKVDPSVSNALTIAFNPAAWFATVDFSAATLDVTGSISIGQDSNPEIWKQIRENIKRSTKFGEDKDNDGELKDDEAEGDGDEGLEADKTEEDAVDAEDAEKKVDEEKKETATES